MIHLFLINAAVVLCWMLLFWLLSKSLHNVAIVDIAWGFGFVLVAITSQLCSASDGVNHWLLPVLVGLWGCRLGLYLAWRNLGKPEDKRYQAMRDLRGPAFVHSSLWVVFLPQGALILLISLPIQVGILEASNAWHSLHFLGMTLWFIGLLFETVSDYQLARFLTDPASKGKVMNRGLWYYTRHPNYFGDFVVWWGFYCVAMAGVSKSVWWTIIGPLVMSFLLLRVSGVPLLEQTLKTTRPGYADYIQRTNSFFPWWPKTR